VVFRLGIVALLVVLGSFAPGIHERACGAEADRTNPEDGAVVDGVYSNDYFALRYPLPKGWKQGPRLARPSYEGYYVLGTPTPPEGVRAALVIAAQDVFFAAHQFGNASEYARELWQSAHGWGGSANEPTEVTIGGHRFVRVNLDGSPLSRVVLAADIRCHVLIFALTGTQMEPLEALERSLEQLSFATDERREVCVRGYATASTLLRRVDPVAVGPRFLKISVRIIIGTDGRIRHTHVIRAFPEQRRSIEDALAQWEFKPYRVDGHLAEVETGLVFEFKPAPPRN
jgi:hypothetical protein